MVTVLFVLDHCARDVPGLERVVRAALWNYLASLLNNFLGFVFWILVFTLTGSEIVGYVIAITALSDIISTVASLGIDVGLLRHLSEAFSKGDLADCRAYAGTAFTYWLCVGLGAFIILVILGLLGFRLGNYGHIHLLFTAALCLANSIGVTFVYILIASLQTQYYFYAIAIANVVKISLLIVLVLLGHRLLAIMLAYISLSLCVAAVCSIFALHIVKVKPVFSIEHFKKLITVGLTQWVPSMLTLVVQNVGIILLFSLNGAITTGIFYIAYTVANFVVGFVSGIQSLMLPYLSGIERDRERQAWYSLRLCLGTILPVIVVVGVFSKEVLSLIRPEYAVGWLILDLVLVTQLVNLNVRPIINLLYACNMYRTVLIITTLAAIVRVLLYCLLVPSYDGVGLALTYLITSLIGLALALSVRRYVNYSVDLRYVSRLGVAGLMLFIVTYVVHMFVPCVVAVVPLIVLGYVIILKMGLATRNDIITLGRALLPQHVRQRLNPYADKLLDLLCG